MKNIISIWKPVGLTPLQTLGELRIKLPKYKDEKLSYAGRLDPMAEGVMIVLVGEENKKRDEHLRVDKEYEFEVLFGIKTDTYDLMGISEYKQTEINQEKLEDSVSDLVGEIEQEYPPFSGKTIDGVKMFELAKEGKLPKELPKLMGKVYESRLMSVDTKKFKEVKKHVNDTASSVKGDFRQEEILNAWNNLEIDADEEFVIANIRIFCSSGVFMRAIANELGEKLGGVALAYSIRRTKVGKYVEKDCIKI